MRVLRWGAFMALCGAGAFWALTRPAPLPNTAFAPGNPELGAEIFVAGGCSSCHAEQGSEGDDKLVLSGGRGFETPFGTFYAPNISPSKAGIGGWSDAEFVRAMQAGVSPDGEHYYPAFPYVAYANADAQDIVHLKAYIDTLPASDAINQEHELALPFRLRRGLGLWKRLYADKGWVMEPVEDPQLIRGRMLVEGLGHCGECHTPRDGFGGLKRDAWLTGAPNPSGAGRIPGITPSQLAWSEEDIAYYLETGFTPDFDTAGGSMAEVVENTALLSAEDRAAMAAYLKAVQ